MGTRKRGTELVFNLQWRNKPDNGGHKSNVIGIYDSPATILNFETFKSYLLKNSGVAGDDVKVTYLTDNGQEWVIDSQVVFQIALCAFRLKARLGEVIFLKLDMIHNGKDKKQDTNDVQTQSEYESLQNGVDMAPEWFVAYMQQFKRELVEEVTWGVTSNLTSLVKDKEPIVAEVVAPAPSAPVTYNTCQSRKSVKHECVKKTKRHMHGDASADKDLIKTYKFDRKLESKLDKLDAKTKKIKEKKLALINKTFDFSERAFVSLGRKDVIPICVENNEQQAKVLYDDNGTPLLNAALEQENLGIPRMMGGETYLHKWNVVNNGLSPWTNDTELRWTWGSAELKPSAMVIRCPTLKPGEKGTLSVVFQIPKFPGQYESYWNFYDKDIRFGQWLSCCIMVESPLTSDCLVPKKAKIEMLEEKQIVPEESVSKAMADLKLNSEPYCALKPNYGISESELIVDLSKTSSQNVAKDVINDDDNNNNGGIDNNSHRGSICELSSDSSSVSSGYDVLTAPICEDKDEDDVGTGYVYITINGDKLPVPKYILRPDFLASAEEAPGPLQSLDIKPEVEEPLPNYEALSAQLQQEVVALEENRNLLSHCSATGSCFSDINSEMNKSRLFIFPRNNPGFEVVNPENTDETQQPEAGAAAVAPSAPSVPVYANTESSSSTGESSIGSVKQMPHVPNYQQTPRNPPKEERAASPRAAATPPRAASTPPRAASTPPRAATSPRASPTSQPIHVLPENLVTGAVNVASSAINTARSVINMMIPPKSEGKWVNGHWVGENPESVRAKNLRILTDMGFWDIDLNATLLGRYKDDLSRVVQELLQQ